jgi:hypothetical protein
MQFMRAVEGAIRPAQIGRAPAAAIVENLGEGMRGRRGLGM